MTSSLYNIYNRVTFVGTLTVTCLAIAAVAMAMSSIAIDLLRPPTPTASITTTTSELVRSSMHLNNGTRKEIDRLIVYVNGTVDLTSVWNWNTKQLFVMFVVEYATKNYKRNELNIMDYIIREKKDAFLNISEPVAKYPFDDIGLDQIVNNPTVVVKVKYHVMTISGWSPLREMTAEQGGVVSVKMPSKYRKQATMIGRQ